MLVNEKYYFVSTEEVDEFEQVVRVSGYYFMNHQLFLREWLEFDGVEQLVHEVLEKDLSVRLCKFNMSSLVEIHEVLGRTFERLGGLLTEDEYVDTNMMEREVLFEMFSVSKDHEEDVELSDVHVIEHVYYLVGEMLRALEGVAQLGEVVGDRVVDMFGEEIGI